jgi:uncharacterized protein (TIGR00299 family) protein
MLAYLDCFSGISGDMTLGALIDLGVPVEWLKDQLRRLPLNNFDIAVNVVHRNGIQARQVEVKILDDRSSRNYSHIRELIQSSPLADSVKTNSLNIFGKLAEAEAGIHGCPIDAVHFHEVGGIDAIVDIVGAALGIEYLAINKIIASPIPLGKGFVKCSHGKLPVPAPATLGILTDIPVYGTDIPHELVTPTGAAIVATLAVDYGAMPPMAIRKIGYGAGQRELADRPNLVRVILGDGSQNHTEILEDQIEIIETSIDDMNPELFGHLMERLFDAGALDVYWIPVYMKKNRPGTLLQVLCKNDRRDPLIHLILSETTTLGVRHYESRRQLLWRDQMEFESSFGKVTVKRVRDPRGNIRLVPEYDICRQIALERDLPLRVVYETVAREAVEWNDE